MADNPRKMLALSLRARGIELLDGLVSLVQAGQASFFNSDGSLKDYGTLERDYIVTSLMVAGGNASKAADMMGIGRATMSRKIREYGINLDKIKLEYSNP